jgi:hypothetical protein
MCEFAGLLPAGKYTTINKWFKEQAQHTTINKWFKEQAQYSLQCPDGDLIAVVDNEQVVGKTWTIKPDNRVSVSVITNITVLPLTSSIEIQNRGSPSKELVAG